MRLAICAIDNIATRRSLLQNGFRFVCLVLRAINVRRRRSSYFLKSECEAISPASSEDRRIRPVFAVWAVAREGVTLTITRVENGKYTSCQSCEKVSLRCLRVGLDEQR